MQPASTTLDLCPSAGSDVAQRSLVVDVSQHATALCIFNVNEQSCLSRTRHATIWLGEVIHSSGRRNRVAVKVPRGHFENCAELKRVMSMRMHEHAVVWSRLHHTHMSALIAYHSNNGTPILITPYLSNGGIIKYLKAHLHTSNRFKFIMVKDVVTALVFLHSQGVVHANIHTDNIMIDDIGRAILCDPGVDDVMRSMDDYSPVHPRYRVKAPELLSPETDAIPRPTQAADIYSLGHAIQEILTLRIPFPEVKDEVEFLIRCTTGQLSKIRPTEINTFVWDILEECRVPRPQDRPSSERLLELFEALVISAT